MTLTGTRPLLLANSYFLAYDEKQTRKMKPYAPLATLMSAALLRERGHEVTFFDATLASGVEEFEAKLDATRPAVVALLEDNFNFLTKMCTLRMRRAAQDMIKASVARGCRTIVNGSDATDRPELYLEVGADAVIVGEVEDTLCEVMALLAADPSASLEHVPGLALAPPAHPLNGGTPGSPLRTGLRPRLDDLDALPFPAWDLVDVEKYRTAWADAHGRLSWSVVTSRGCPYGCNWCAKPIFGRQYSQRGAARVAEELKLLRQHVDPDHVWFADDIFGLTAGWIEEFARAVTARDAKIPFTIQSRVNLMTPRSVEALRVAGAEEVWCGVESGSQQVLDAMEKGTKIEDVRTATQLLKQHGIHSGWFIQLGYLGETREDLERTRALILEERPDEIGVSVSYPLPGTPFFETVRSQVGRKQNWEHTDDLDMLFHGTYTADFYRRVRDILHRDVDAYRAGEESNDDEWNALWSREAEFLNSVEAL